MKIITEDFNRNYYCYVQVRDIAYLVEHKRCRYFLSLYQRCINEGKSDYDFLRITDPHGISIILHSDEIISFTDYLKENPIYLSRVLINSIYGDGEHVKLKCDAIRDILAFQKGELLYKIPILPTREYACVNEKDKVMLSTSILPNCYIVQTSDGSTLESRNYQKFVDEQIDKVLEHDHLTRDQVDVVQVPIGESIVIRISKKQVKKESFIKRLFNKKQPK